MSAKNFLENLLGSAMAMLAMAMLPLVSAQCSCASPLFHHLFSFVLLALPTGGRAAERPMGGGNSCDCRPARHRCYGIGLPYRRVWGRPEALRVLRRWLLSTTVSRIVEADNPNHRWSG
eukprot:COSAG03_NODE_1920_length_3353_cov_7.316226_5_plen_119_part_00